MPRTLSRRAHARAQLSAAVECSACTNGRGCITACKAIGHIHAKCAFPSSRDPGQCCACWSAPVPEADASKSQEASFCDPLITAAAGANATSAAAARMREIRRTKSSRNLFWSFEACGGLTNQRISIIHGLMASYLMRATTILPRLNPNGVQRPGSGYTEVRTNLVPFDTYYDREALVAGLEPLGMRVASLADEERFYTGASAWPLRRKMATALHVRNQHHPASWYTRVARDHMADSNSAAVLVGDCAFFSLQMQQDPELGKLFWQIDSALVFAHWIQEKANRIVTSITRASRALGVVDGSFNALHVRSEPDWKQHCQKWEDVAAERDNCMTNTEHLPRVFAIEGVSPSKPVYLAGEFTSASLERTSSLSALAASSYRLHTKDRLDPLLNNASGLLDRDLLAAIDFAVVRSAQTFIGNSVSTFSAMVLLWRQKERAASHLSCNDFKEGLQQLARSRTTHPCRLDAFHYNGGDIPLQGVLFGETSLGALPQRGLKWVFTVTSAGVDYAEATRIAVASALERTSLTPVCIWAGEKNELSNWLISKGVRVVHHVPEWKDRLMHAMHRARRLGHATKSPLYMSSERMLGTWLRLDAATLGFVDRYVLYTDVDVIFEQDIGVQDFGSPLPRYFTLGTEANSNMCGVLLDTMGSSSMFFGSSFQGPPRYAKVGNAGVMLMNMEGLRRTHAQFVRWVFSTTNLKKGLFFDEYGPGDQGAFNKFYEGKFAVRPWPLFNWKPYWGYNARAKLIHFHGPKPLDYMCHLHGSLQNCSGSSQVFEDLLKQCTATEELSPAPSVRTCTWANGCCERHPRLDVCKGVLGRLPKGQGSCYRHVATYLRWRRTVLIEMPGTRPNVVSDATPSLQRLGIRGRLNRIAAAAPRLTPAEHPQQVAVSSSEKMDALVSSAVAQWPALEDILGKSETSRGVIHL